MDMDNWAKNLFDWFIDLQKNMNDTCQNLEEEINRTVDDCSLDLIRITEEFEEYIDEITVEINQVFEETQIFINELVEFVLDDQLTDNNNLENDDRSSLEDFSDWDQFYVDEPIKAKPNPQKHPACVGCRNYHGHNYGGNFLVCAMYPYGWENDRCPDWESDNVK